MLSPGQADRRAVGRRRGRLPGRQLSRCCGREWNGKYRDYGALASGAATTARSASSRFRLTGSSDLYQTTAAALRQHQLHHRPRRLHAARPRLLQRQAQRGQRRGQPRRHQRQQLVELRRRRADRRPGDHRAPRAAEAQLPGDAVSLPGRADALRRRRVRPHAARQQQRLLPGQRDSWFDWISPERERAARVHRQADRLPQGARPASSPAREFLLGHEPSRGSGCTDVVPGSASDGERMTEEDWGARIAGGAGHVPHAGGDRLARLARSPGARRVVA